MNDRPTSGAPAVVTYESLRDDPDVRELLLAADMQMEAIGYTEHGIRHARKVADIAGDILQSLERYDDRQVELARIAGLLHDIGNMIHRNTHAMSSALLAFDLLRERGMPLREITQVVAAIGSHDEAEDGKPTTDIGAAVIIADKADVARERVRNPVMAAFDIHDRINYAARSTTLRVDAAARTISLIIEIDLEIGSVMEYFEIFLERMVISRKAAQMLGCSFGLLINDVRLI
ncbi:MAG: HD domain-containing protein [Armatimonadetes bacterium]|nr:HD domain-containing protein [Armatimonadota bacterium]